MGADLFIASCATTPPTRPTTRTPASRASRFLITPLFFIVPSFSSDTKAQGEMGRGRHRCAHVRRPPIHPGLCLLDARSFPCRDRREPTTEAAGVNAVVSGEMVRVSLLRRL